MAQVTDKDKVIVPDPIPENVAKNFLFSFGLIGGWESRTIPHSVWTFRIFRANRYSNRHYFRNACGIWSNCLIWAGRLIHFSFLHRALSIKIYNVSYIVYVCSFHIYCVMNGFIYIHLHENEKLFTFPFSLVGWMQSTEFVLLCRNSNGKIKHCNEFHHFLSHSTTALSTPNILHH